MNSKKAKNPLIEKHVKLFRKLSGQGGGISLRLHRWPESVLPAPKSEIKSEIEKEMEKGDGCYPNDVLQGAIETLGLFESGQEPKVQFKGRILTIPFFISLVYTIWIAAHGSSWLWVLLPVIFFVGVSWSLSILMTPKKRNFGRTLLLEFFRFAVLISYAGVWIRLVCYSGLYGIYTSTIKGFSLGHLLGSLFILFVGYFFSRYLNTMHYFVFNNEYKGFPVNEKQ